LIAFLSRDQKLHKSLPKSPFLEVTPNLNGLNSFGTQFLPALSITYVYLNSEKIVKIDDPVLVLMFCRRGSVWIWLVNDTRLDDRSWLSNNTRLVKGFKRVQPSICYNLIIIIFFKFFSEIEHPISTKNTDKRGSHRKMCWGGFCKPSFTKRYNKIKISKFPS